MTQERRERLHAALMGDPAEVAEMKERAPGIYADLEVMVAADVERIEPLVDGWLKEAEGENDGEK